MNETNRIVRILTHKNMLKWNKTGKTRADIQKITGLNRNTINDYITRHQYDVPYSKQWKKRNEPQIKKSNSLNIAW